MTIYFSLHFRIWLFFVTSATQGSRLLIRSLIGLRAGLCHFAILLLLLVDSVKVGGLDKGNFNLVGSGGANIIELSACSANLLHHDDTLVLEKLHNRDSVGDCSTKSGDGDLWVTFVKTVLRVVNVPEFALVRANTNNRVATVFVGHLCIKVKVAVFFVGIKVAL
ncbi:hypothetical protein, conserved [Leishmania tarentolae]|uniref:Uncharacterized protein n=1 Tax=Leishmania tarentolae TaxID=5689 RepID=A0A640KBE1_LEITA|nr:hypothetical protein, conserved [Leishmania tarentolae]